VSSSDVPDSLRELARAADAAASRCRPWQVGHELAKDLTANARSMTAEEVAVVQALEWQLDRAEGGAGHTFRAWRLDEDTALGEVHHTWPEVWELVVSAATHPTVVAHLSDLLWSARHGPSHVHARRSVDAYLDAAEIVEEGHDRARFIIRAVELAGAIGDSERLSRATQVGCDHIEAALSAGDHSLVVSLLEHLVTRRRPDDAARPVELLQVAWQAVARSDHVERLGKLLLSRSTSESQRRQVAERIVAEFRRRAEREEGFSRLLALREALRVTEELGHPSHGDILHEIETLDPDSAYTALRTEHVLSRQDVAAFCAAVVGNDSLEHGLSRFALHLPISPQSVERLRKATPIGLRHVVTNYRIGEANSVVTSSETGDPNQDRIAAALERDVLQQAGHQALLTAFLFLVPALHQTLRSYEPWDLADLKEILERGPADPVVADAMARSLQHFSDGRYDEALHVALPRVERLIRHIARSCGVATTKRPTKRVGGIRGLGEILADLRGDGSPILPEPLLTAAELILTHPDSLNLRNEFLHGISNEARPAEAALVIQLGMCLSLCIRVQPPRPTS